VSYRGLAGALALLVFLGWLFGATRPVTVDAAPAGNFCQRNGPGEEVDWRHIHDGDTLTLADGRKVRVIGLNAPEVAHSGHGGDPFANEATIAARNFLRDSSKIVLQPGVEQKDRHGRLLAHVFRPGDGASLASDLLAQGLAWQIAVPPNLGYLECNRAAESKARAEGRGLWSRQYLDSSQSVALRSGFRVLSARIERVALKKDWWLETDTGFVARIPVANRGLFGRADIERLPGHVVEVRGWMYQRSAKPPYSSWVLLLRHPSALQLLD
jgi:endonuclease YncB( thermonuclease family)